MAYLGEPRKCGASARYSHQDFPDDPLLPQKALPLPDDLDDDSVLQNGPADVVAAAASAMAACDSLPDAAAESLMQPLAEAYLLAVRREAQSLPKVVSAVSGGKRTRQRLESGTASSDAVSVLNTSGPCMSTISGCTHVTRSSDSSHAEDKGKMVTSESSGNASTQSVAVSSAAKPSCPVKSAWHKKVYRDFSDISSNADEVGSIGCSVVSPLYASSDEEERGCEPVSVAQFIRDTRDLEGSTSEGIEAGIEREKVVGTSSKESTGCDVADAPESTEQRTVSRSRRKSNEDTKVAAVVADGQGHGPTTIARESLGESSRAAEITCQQVQESFISVVKGADVEVLPQDSCADADYVCGASHVGASDESLFPVSAGKEARGAPAEAETAAFDSHAAGPCVWRAKAEAGQSSKGSRPKVVAAYVDRLILLDRQREAASASAVAPAAEWRAAALHQFKRLRNYVNSDEFPLSEDQQQEVGTDCLSWNEQEWQLYCRCYPPSLRLLGACDTVTLCKVLFLLVEDLKLQQRVVAKAERERSSNVGCDGSSSRGPGLVAEELSQRGQDVADIETKNEHTDALPDEIRSHEQRRTGEAQQVDERDRTSEAHTRQRQCEDEREGELGTNERHEHGDKQQDVTAVVQLQPSAEEDYLSPKCAIDKEDGANVAEGRTPVAKDADDAESGLRDGKRTSAEKTRVNAIANEGTCKCCRHRDCCVTLQQACWLFGVFVFLDELQVLLLLLARKPLVGVVQSLEDIAGQTSAVPLYPCLHSFALRDTIAKAMDADVASCIQQLRRICESAREQASCRRATAQLRFPSTPRAAEGSESTSEGRMGGTQLMENEKEIITWVPNDLVAALNVLIVVINDFFNQR